MDNPADRPHRPEDTERIIDELAWDAERRWWRENFRSRPYVTADGEFDEYEPAWRYGFESAGHHHGREWNEVEPELREGWPHYEHRGRRNPRWDEVRESVRDAWDHLRGREHGGHVDRSIM